MELIPWFWLTTILIVGITIVAAGSWFWKKNEKLPPGPKGVPILGHLHMLGKNPHQDLLRMAKHHGPIMCLKLGLVRNIVVSSPEAAELFLKTHDLVFANRPPHEVAKYLTWDQRNLTFGAYSPYWRKMRKLCILELLSTLKINHFQPMRKEELLLCVESIKEAAKEGVAVDLSAKVTSMMTDMSCRMVVGKKYGDKEAHERGFKAVIGEGLKLIALPNLSDFFPLLGFLDLQGITKRTKALAKACDDFLEKIIDEHVRAAEEDHEQTKVKDMVDTLISIMQRGDLHNEFQFDRRHVKAIMLDMLVASMDTAAAQIEWILSELLRNPSVMKNVQKELEQVVGLKRMVEEADLDRLEYLDMVVKETFRLHPSVPLLIPHFSMEDITVNGYHIPKESRIIVNAYAIGRDPHVWTDPERFSPERFAATDIDVRGQHFQLIPFSSGRRGCPGIQLGLIQLKLVVSQLVHCFHWKLPNDMHPEALDMTEDFGLIVSRANHLKALPTFRLHIN